MSTFSRETVVEAPGIETGAGTGQNERKALQNKANVALGEAGSYPVESRTESPRSATSGPVKGPVAALYVMPDGHYPDLVRDWYDEKRDAKTYDGPWPVVAHPPCGPWGLMRGLCTKQDPTCGPRAVEQVRRWGGVLEHPADSLLWRRCDMPRPGELPDAYGGRTYLVKQVAWGHSCDKPTWLYVVGVDPYLVLSGIRVGGTPTHRVTSGPGGPRLPSATKRARTVTPIAFAKWLVELAASVST